MKFNKRIGWVFIFLALLFINIIPDPTDILTLQVYSAFTGADISPDNLPVVYLDFTIWSFMVGGIFLLIGMYYLGWSFKKLWRKIDPGKYRVAILLAIAAVLFVSAFDIWSMNSGVFGSAIDYTNGDYLSGWWDLFIKFVLSFFIVVPICYYFLVRQDFSESLAVFLTSYVMYMGGLADIFYFIFQRIPIPSRLPWLDGHVFIGWVATTLGFPGVTNISLIIGVFISFLIVFLMTKVLKDYF